jgi:mannose-1-phosphate guanylyltransferase
MFAVIMAGGSGTRFWPVSRKNRPKQFLNIIGKEPMVVETCERLRPLSRDEEMVLVLGREHLQEASELFKDRNIHMLAEPMGRNTAPCIGLGAVYALSMDYTGAVAFLPADHFIADTAAFVEGLRQAHRIAELGGIVTLGIEPNRPETGYGYIHRGERFPDTQGTTLYKVSAFVEKPDFGTARQYLESGDYFWNAGIFVARPDTILEEIDLHLPNLSDGLKRLKSAVGTEEFESVIEEVYGGLESVSFDHGIMEKTKKPTFVVPCQCGWSDVGSWASVYELRTEDYDGDNNLSEGECLVIDCKKSFVSGNSGRLVACLGLENCLVVDTPEALLVADMRRSQEIRHIVELLKRRGKEESV